jgi:sec-independent protein translocase protein TatA
MRPPQGFEWLLILFIILLLFGAKRLPDMARGLGRSLRILKAETRGMAEDDADDAAAAKADASSEPPAVTDRPAPPAPAPGPAQAEAQADNAERATGGPAPS